MSLAIFDFTNPSKQRLFWLTVGLSLFLAVLSTALLIASHLKEQALELQIHEANEAALFVAPPDILDPQAKFNDLGDYEDTLPLADPPLPSPAAPERILDPTWNVKFIKPTQEII